LRTIFFFLLSCSLNEKCWVEFRRWREGRAGWRRVNVSRYRRGLFVGWAIYRFFYSRPKGTEILRRQCRLCHRRHSLARLCIKEAVEFDSFQFFFVARFHFYRWAQLWREKNKNTNSLFLFFLSGYLYAVCVIRGIGIEREDQCLQHDPLL
jgi:hypothetical protein